MALMKNCAVCGVEFRTYPCLVAVGKGKYCSKTCSDSVTLLKPGTQLGRLAKGIKLSEATKAKMRGRKPWNAGTFGMGICKANIGSFRPGERRNPATEFKIGDKPPHTGQLRPEITGPNHPNWRGGSSRYPRGWNREFKAVIRNRDGYRCQICGVDEITSDRVLCVHHIDYDKTNLQPNNLVTLCRSCHGKTSWNREYWMELLARPEGVMQHANNG